jgi:hypothetical protein
MTDDARIDSMIEYAYLCMDQAGWKYIDCPACGYPRLLKVNILCHCEECGAKTQQYEEIED